MATLRKVAWCNLWNYARAMDTDTGSLIHLTTDPGLTGRTLCGRLYPADKGHPWCGRLCKRCRARASQPTIGAAVGTAGWLTALPWIESREE